MIKECHDSLWDGPPRKSTSHVGTSGRCLLFYWPQMRDDVELYEILLAAAMEAYFELFQQH